MTESPASPADPDRAVATPEVSRSAPDVDVDTLVVGAGVIGLAVARRLSRVNRRVAVIEAMDEIGTQVSSRSSEVIHAGIYYAADSLKARLCVRGRDELYRYCADHGVPHRRIGKLIVAADESQMPGLERIRAHADANGVHDLRLLRGDELHRREPALRGVGALLSPSTGIVDSAALMRAFVRDIGAAEGIVALRTGLRAAHADRSGFVVELGDGTGLRCHELINCAGLVSWSVAESVTVAKSLAVTEAVSTIPPRYLAKGNYFGLASGSAPFDHLVYPLPVDGGLGVHLTLDLAGAARFGPDVQWLPSDADDNTVDLRVDETRVAQFATAIGNYWPDLTADMLVPAYAGIRPKVSGPGMPAADFVISGPRVHRIPGLVHLFGIESPGLTSCLAIAEEVERELATA
ncbi:NAD(P)/FAD-dependent oxidoreductase [Gordonia sp. ABSL1-1]|uniref:NAD(P)/FAD-dependent oxidoreductase n=1 Tax=Gordonia sp. ABSL1-1 TaxID=3053923 RepID=UPI0025727B13|nr:NAD(P)/FAD-dependent oxidoreductase [Gordonia sp. ABSL1-1]MDL9935934.1 NAD(P)/FAD-dependent oxidoreductase [Gordonia sp. ABSL1-1]